MLSVNSHVVKEGDEGLDKKEEDEQIHKELEEMKPNMVSVTEDRGRRLRGSLSTRRQHN